jgi:Spy/CpxP family protein refolding chaperone
MSNLHQSTFDHLSPTLEQTQQMQQLRYAASIYATALEQNIPDGPDKTYLLRKLREVAMWANVAVTRNTDGSPR